MPHTDPVSPPAPPVDSSQELPNLLTHRERTFDLAMAASDMGTWRYTLADNICDYDENAQRLYGLTESRFLHDAEGMSAMLHPDDLEAVRERMAAALQPDGNGRYNVEYRVKQLDGSWRWVSAWGQVEFDGDEANRHPVAIVGASRDRTERKDAEARHRLLLNELEHRLKKYAGDSSSNRGADLKLGRGFVFGQSSVGAAHNCDGKGPRPSYCRLWDWR